jgi:phosphoglycolate phosphatase-like HAD superfamily hydrolase
VSNNPVEEVRRILQNARVDTFFDLIIGNDHEGRRQKPAPDSYLLACDRLGIESRETVVLEDSLIGVEAGRRAGAFTVGVASGGATFDELQGAGMANVTYLDLAGGAGLARAGQSEGIATPMSSISRYLEALLSATGFDDGLSWKNDDWTWLGWTLGHALKERLSTLAGFQATRRDRDVEVELDARSSPVFDVRVRSNGTADIAPAIRAGWADPRRIPVRILDGLAEALEARIGIAAPTAGPEPELWTTVFRLLGDAIRVARSPGI